MAGTPTNRILENGPRWLITEHVYFASDGTNETSVLKVLGAATGTLTAGAASVTSLTAISSGTVNAQTQLAVGMSVIGSGIPTGTTIAAIGSATGITLSQNAYNTGAQSLFFNGIGPDLGTTKSHAKLKRIYYNVVPQAGALRIQWDASTPADIALVNGWGDLDLRDGTVGGPQGIFDDATTGNTGSVLFTTSGLTNTVVGGYTVVLFFTKGTQTY